jgi:thiosulfate dehydrogenase [quinone] large subunit
MSRVRLDSKGDSMSGRSRNESLADRGRLERLVLSSVRIGLGLMWLVNVGWKVPPDFGEASGTALFRFTRAAVDHEVFAPYATLVRNLVLPNFRLFGWLVLIVEASLGAFLLLGWKIRIWSLIGVAQSVAIGLSVLNLEHEWPWSYYLMVLAHLAVFATAAPPAGGLDRAVLTEPGRRQYCAVLAGVAVIGGLAGLIAALVDGGPSNLGWGGIELTLMRFNVAGAVLVIVTGILAFAALLAERPRWLIAPAVMAAAGVVASLAVWRRGEANFLGADGRSLSFELMLAVGFGVLATRRPVRS